MNNKYFYIFIFFLIISTNSNHVHAEDLSSTTPADNATQIAVNTDITLVWAGNVSTNSGNVILKKTSDDSTVESFASGEMFLIADMSGNVSAIINPSSDLDEDTEYYVLIDSSAFNGFDGISSKTTLNFKTVDNNNPSLSSSSPSDDAANVSVSSNIVLTFNEAVDAESGNIDIVNTSTGEAIEIDVTGVLLSGSGTTEITINPSSDLEHDTSYHVKIDSTAFDDVAGNSYSGISTTTALNFSTKPEKVFSNTTVKTLTKNQSTASVNSLNQSMNRIAGRMNYIRSGNNNSSNQNIKLAMNLDSPLANQVLNSLSEKFLQKQKVTKKWGAWSEGNISFGRIGQQDGNLGQDIHSDGITFGIDKRINDEKTIGFAISKSWQETEVGSNEGSMDAAAISIMNYTSFKIEDKRFFEMVVGIGEMDIDLSRNVTGGKNTGDRKGNQLFGSLTYLLEPDVEIVGRNLNYYTRIDLGFTQLKAYTETGDGTAVSYKKQNVKSASLSTGLNLSKIIDTNKAILEPSLKFELGKDKTINSVSEAYYINNPSEIYSNAIGDQSSGHLLLNLGLSTKFNNDFTINASYEHYRSTNEAFNNNFSIYLRKPI